MKSQRCTWRTWEIQHHTKSYIDSGTHVNVADQGAVERSAGKARRVIDKRTQD